MNEMETLIRLAEVFGTAVAASWITRILTIRARVRQEQADADKKEEEVKSDQIDNIERMVEKAYKPIIEDLTEQVRKLQAKVDKLEEDKDRQNERIEELEEENRALRSVLREARPDLVPSRRGQNGKKAPRSEDGKFVRKEES